MTREVAAFFYARLLVWLPAHPFDHRATYIHHHLVCFQFFWLLHIFSTFGSFARFRIRLLLFRRCSSPPPAACVSFNLCVLNNKLALNWNNSLEIVYIISVDRQRRKKAHMHDALARTHTWMYVYEWVKRATEWWLWLYHVKRFSKWSMRWKSYPLNDNIQKK